MLKNEKLKTIFQKKSRGDALRTLRWCRKVRGKKSSWIKVGWGRNLIHPCLTYNSYVPIPSLLPSILFCFQTAALRHVSLNQVYLYIYILTRRIETYKHNYYTNAKHVYTNAQTQLYKPTNSFTYEHTLQTKFTQI